MQNSKKITTTKAKAPRNANCKVLGHAGYAGGTSKTTLQILMAQALCQYKANSTANIGDEK